MKVLNVTENEDGSMDLEYQLTEEESNLLFIAGLRRLMVDDGMTVRPFDNTIDEVLARVEMPEGMMNDVINCAVLTSLKDACDAVLEVD